MPLRPFLRVVPMALLALTLAACGNKGPLVKPSPQPAPKSQPAAAPEPAGH